MKDENVQFVIPKIEALVLFEFLSRFSDTEKLTIEDKSEEIVLWNLNCILEKVLVEPFKEDYHAVLNKAKSKIKLNYE